MTVFDPSITPDHEENHGLDAARKALMGENAKSFDVDKILAGNRAHEDRQKRLQSEKEETLDQEIAAARLHGNQKQVHTLEQMRLQHTKDHAHALEVVRRTLDMQKVPKMEVQNKLKK